MAQNYHDEIRAALAAQGINNQTPQDVRDRAILAHNQSRGRDPLMALFGSRNEGIAPAQSAQVAAQSPRTTPQMPAQAPVPSARPMDAAIEASLGDNVPVPTPRPDVATAAAPIEQGDLSAMEQIAASRSPIAEAVTASMADTPEAQTNTPVPQTAQVEPEEAAAQQEADATAGLSENAANLLNAVIMLGGTAAAGALYQRYQQGDPDAMRTFAAIGMDPDDFSMFSGEASSAYDNRTPRLGAPNAQLEAPRLALPAPTGNEPIAERFNSDPIPVHRAVAPTQHAEDDKPRQRVPARTRQEGDEKPRVRAKAPKVKR